MQLNCKVNVVNRLLPSAGQSGPSRLVWSNVTLTENKASVIELSLATSRNKTGMKYKVTNNIEQIFSKFVSQGKLTLRFRQPAHDLCLSGEVRHMEKILAIIKGEDSQLKKGTLCPLLSNRANKVVIPKTKLNILSRADYPVTTSFPDTLTSLKISGIALKKFDRRLLHLKALEVLDLSSNQISILPESIHTLAKLKQLHLNHNEIKVLPSTFVNSTRVICLDISHNQLVMIPSCISRVSGLQILKLDHNKLRSLPSTISKLRSLRTLTVSSNEIRTLPESFQTLALDHIDVFGNPFEKIEQEIALNPESLNLKVPTLRAISAKSTIKFKLKYSEEDIPATLITYLHESSTTCPCGKLCIDDGLPAEGEINLLKVSGSVTGDKIVPMKMTLCTIACFQRFSSKVVS
ncbi:leucine-rich repeat protein 1-like [Daphnia pulex]|uniref:leucine-rich repeat protein 1-like n=1 Tax=Daphnia pulex TaxID=6669 RepID=UPI001EDDF5A8|nr:leucine-rich repeat protein 1-like [Daphnia pulex]XP_046653767.1 leucine-rich repeat protein 1-like [Daphnia pulicaria]